MMNSILWCSPHPNHYHQYLTQKIIESGIKIDQIYFRKIIAKYPWKSDFLESDAKILHKGFLGVDWGFICAGQWRRYRQIVIAGWNEPTMIVLLFLLCVSKKRFCIYTDTPKKLTRKGFRQLIRKWWLSQVLRNASFILSTGKPGIDFFLASGYSAEKVINFPFLTNLSYFKPISALTPTNLITIFSSGRLINSHKGYDLGLNALAALKDKGYCFHYRIAGEGPDRQTIIQQINDLNLNAEVKLLGWLEPSELINEYQHSDIFLHAARLDPYPNAVLEAMACGLPVISSDKSGSGIDRIVPGNNGELFQSENVKDLECKLKSILDLSSQERRQMGKKARETALLWDASYHVAIIKKILTES